MVVNLIAALAGYLRLIIMEVFELP